MYIIACNLCNLREIVQIDDLKTPYTTYCTKYRCGFDSWEPVQSNPKLSSVLNNFSLLNPPHPSVTILHGADPSVWTLDNLFLLPKTRLKYYKKLYGRLLKSTAPGRSDYKLLVGALETLDTLLATLESRNHILVSELNTPPALPTKQPIEDNGDNLVDQQSEGAPDKTREDVPIATLSDTPLPETTIDSHELPQPSQVQPVQTR
jgi:hypothetical protein